MTFLITLTFASLCTFEEPQVGRPAPELNFASILQAPHGTKANWNSLKGKVVVLEFWTTWCGPCVASIPHLNDLCEKLAGQPIQFISVTDEPAATIDSFIKKKKMKSWVALDSDKSTFRAYGVHSIPHTVLVDRKGIIVGIASPTDLDEKLLRDVIAGKKPSLPEPPPAVASPAPNEPPLYQVIIRKTPITEKSCGTTRGPGILKMNGHELRSVLSEAYDLRESRLITDGSWAGERYDVTIATPPSKEAQIHETLRDALSRALDISVDREIKEMDGYVLSLPADRKTHLETSVAGGRSTSGMDGQLQAVSLDLPGLASVLESYLKRPVLDETNLDGRYDIELKWKAGDSDSLLAAVRDTLGLRVESKPCKIEVGFAKRPAFHPIERP